MRARTSPTLGWRFWRRMREAAYKKGYADALADVALMKSPAPLLEDPFPASDWDADSVHP